MNELSRSNSSCEEEQSSPTAVVGSRSNRSYRAEKLKHSGRRSEPKSVFSQSTTEKRPWRGVSNDLPPESNPHHTLFRRPRENLPQFAEKRHLLGKGRDGFIFTLDEFNESPCSSITNYWVVKVPRFEIGLKCQNYLEAVAAHAREKRLPNPFEQALEELKTTFCYEQWLQAEVFRLLKLYLHMNCGWSQKDGESFTPIGTPCAPGAKKRWASFGSRENLPPAESPTRRKEVTTSARGRLGFRRSRDSTKSSDGTSNLSDIEWSRDFKGPVYIECSDDSSYRERQRRFTVDLETCHVMPWALMDAASAFSRDTAGTPVGWTSNLFISFLYDITQQLVLLEDLGIVHGDIKLTNVLLLRNAQTDKYIFVLSDYWDAFKISNGRLKSTCEAEVLHSWKMRSEKFGTRSFKDPCLIEYCRCNGTINGTPAKLDASEINMWSLGIIMAFHLCPVNDDHRFEERRNRIRNQILYSDRHGRKAKVDSAKAVGQMKDEFKKLQRYTGRFAYEQRHDGFLKWLKTNLFRKILKPWGERQRASQFRGEMEEKLRSTCNFNRFKRYFTEDYDTEKLNKSD